MVDLCHFDIFLTIFRGPSGIHQNCDFDMFLTIFRKSAFYRLCRAGPLQSLLSSSASEIDTGSLWFGTKAVLRLKVSEGKKQELG